MNRCRLFALLAITTIIAANSAWPATERARLLRVQGLVKVKPAQTGQWHKASLPNSSSLAARDEVQTYQQARATIGIDGGRVEMSPLTRVAIPAAAPGKTSRTASRLSVLTGRIFVWIIGARPLEIGTAGAIACAKSTQFIVEADEAGRTMLTVIEGSVEFSNEAGTVMVAANQQSTAAPGKAPTRPIRVDKSSYIEWEATLDSLWLGYEKLYNPGDSREALRLKTEQAVQNAVTGEAGALEAAGDLLHDTGDLNAADEMYRKAIQAAPLNSEVRLKLGYNLLQQGRVAEAVDLFGQLAMNGYGPARTGLAAAMAASVNDNKLAAAADLVRARLTAEPNDPEALLVAGLIATRRGQAEAAKAAFTQAAVGDAPDYRALAYLSTVQLAQSDAPAALLSAQRAVALAPASALAHQSLGTAAFYCGTLAEAAAEADIALTLNPQSAPARLLAAQVAVAQGDLDAGLQAAESAVELDPRLAPAHYLIGMIALAQNDLKRSERALSNALALQPKMVAAQTAMGLALARQDKLAEALEMHEGAATLDPGAAGVQNNIGLIYLQTGRLRQAIDTFQGALRLQPGWAIIHANLALAYLESYDYARARNAAERAVALGGDSARVRTTLARVYLRQNRLNAGWAQLRRALELDDSYALAHFHLAEIYVELGRPEDATRERFRALTLQPSAMVDNRQYARTEVEGAVGDITRGTARTMGRGDDGQNSYYVAAQRATGDFDRPRTDVRETTVLGIAGRQTAADETAVIYATAQSQNQERPGQALAGGLPTDADDTSSFRGRELQVLTRQGIWDNADLTWRFGYRDARQETQNPDSLFGDPDPLRTLELSGKGPMAEFRIDKPLGPCDLLTFGSAWTRQRLAIEGLLGMPGTPPTFTPFGNEESRQAATGYLEFQRLLSPRTSLMLGGRMVVAGGTGPVLRPKAWLRHNLTGNSSLVLLTRPILADDVTEVAPVDWYGLRGSISPLDLARGGYAQSYELQYERIPANGVFRASLFQRDLRNLLVDLEDPAWSLRAAPVVLGAATLRGAEVELERQLGRDLTGGVFARYTDSSNDDAGGLDLPYQPKWVGQARLDYLDNNGWRLGLIWSFTGHRFADVGNAVELGSYNVLNATLARQFSLHTDVFVNVGNALNREYGFYRNYPAPGTQVVGGVKYRF